MIRTLDYNPLYNLYCSLNNYISDYVYSKNLIEFKNVDDIVEFVLKSNGCDISQNSSGSLDETNPLNNNTYLYYLKNANANNKNEYFDIIDIYGTTYIIIFLDYFENIQTVRINDDESNDINKRALFLMGNNNYFNALKEICIIVSNAISKNVFQHSTSSISRLYSESTDIIPAKILNNILPITKEDVEGIMNFDFAELKYLVTNMRIDILLIGGRA